MGKDKICKSSYEKNRTYYYMPDQKSITDITNHLRNHLALPVDIKPATKEEDEEDARQSPSKSKTIKSTSVN